MQIVTLQEIKDQLSISFSGKDSDLTRYINLAEGAFLQYIKVGSKAELLERLTGTESPSEELAALTMASLEMAVSYAVGRMYNAALANQQVDVWDKLTVRFLMPYRVPGVGPGTD